MEKTQQAEAGKARWASLAKEEKSALARAGAKARWDKARAAALPKEEPMQPISTKNASSRAKTARRKRAVRRNPVADQQTFMAALRAAEKRLPEAMQEQAEAASQYTILGAEISYLRALIRTMTSQQMPLMTPDYGYSTAQIRPTPPVFAPPAPVSMAQIMSDQPLPSAAPVPAAVPAPSPIQMPVVELPYVPGRAGGGAMDTSIVGEVEDDDAHLKSSAMAGGSWV